MLATTAATLVAPLWCWLGTNIADEAERLYRAIFSRREGRLPADALNDSHIIRLKYSAESNAYLQLIQHRC
jgi:hypothetical protein